MAAGVFLGLAGVFVFVRLGIVGTAVAFGVALVPASIVTWRVQRGRRAAVIPGPHLGPYVIVRKLGEGGMGTVYEARHTALGRRTALKVVKASRFDGDALRRFEREARVTAELCHPNCVTLFDYGRSEQGVYYLAMELIQGSTLDAVLQAEGPISSSRTLRILKQIAGALAHAHAKQLVHRDIKPSNVMLCQKDGHKDFVKVLDFGLAKSLVDQCDISHAKIVGTPLFMSPEATKDGMTAGPPADVYSIGTLGYALLTGECLFEDCSMASLALAHQSEPPLPPSLRSTRAIPRDLEDVLMRCLAKDPNARYADGTQLLAALEACDEVLEDDAPRISRRVRSSVRPSIVETRDLAPMGRRARRRGADSSASTGPH